MPSAQHDPTPERASELDDVLAALASTTRRELFAHLQRRHQTLDALALRAGLSLHRTETEVAVLLAAGLVRARPARRTDGPPIFSVEPKRLQILQAGLAALCGEGFAVEDGIAPGAMSPPAGDAYSPDDDIERRALVLARRLPERPAAVYAIGQRLLRLGKHVDQALKDAASKLGLISAEFLLLDALRSAAPDHLLNPTQLRQRLQMTQGGITKCIARLEAMEMAERLPDPTDGRGVLVRIKPRGLSLLENTDLWGTDSVAASQMSSRHRSSLSQLLGEMLRLADAEAARRGKDLSQD